MQDAGGIFISNELIRALVNGTFASALLVGAGFAVVALVRLIHAGIAWLRLSKIERAKQYLRTHDAEYRQQEQLRETARRVLRRGEVLHQTRRIFPDHGRKISR